MKRYALGGIAVLTAAMLSGCGGQKDKGSVYYLNFKPEQDAQVETFFPGLKKLLTEDKRSEIAELIKYPLLLNGETPLEEKIATKEEFLARFNEIFSEEFKKELLATPDGEIFSSWMGIGVGKGLLWFVPGDKEQSGKILISKFGKHCFTMPDIFEK